MVNTHPQRNFLGCKSLYPVVLFEMVNMYLKAFSRPLVYTSALLLVACGTAAPKPSPVPASTPTALSKQPLRIGLALGGGAAKGFAHIGVITVSYTHLTLPTKRIV